MPVTADTTGIAALRTALEAERAARLHLEAEMADQRAYAARLSRARDAALNCPQD